MHVFQWAMTCAIYFIHVIQLFLMSWTYFEAGEPSLASYIFLMSQTQCPYRTIIYGFLDLDLRPGIICSSLGVNCCDLIWLSFPLLNQTIFIMCISPLLAIKEAYLLIVEYLVHSGLVAHRVVDSGMQPLSLFLYSFILYSMQGINVRL